MTKKGILISFGELFLKSEGVRSNFIKRLINNLRFLLDKNKSDSRIHFLRDRIFVSTDDLNGVKKILNNVSGISNISEGYYSDKGGLEDIFEFIKKNYPKWLKSNETYALRIKTDNLDSKNKKAQIIDEIAYLIKRKVNLSDPHKEINIEIRKNSWLIHFNKEKATGGLPNGSGGKVLVLMSGGIDSPVAGYMMAKRGAENVWLHFHSFPLVSNASINKIEELAKVFLNHQAKLKVYFIPFSKAQIEIKTTADANYRVLLYRRLMLKIAEKIMKQEKCGAMVTGESLGQVSSQTLKNINITQDATKVLVLRPLIGMDKEEIINVSRENNFFDISIKPQEDCCTLFVSKGQTAEGDILKVKEIEKKLNVSKIIRECLKSLEVRNY
ncbi:MAG: tRNA 4-thiouridine(8) synthase ThiI [Candidatus Nealsonbacteria bacterium]|nr:tRNA 4-thiouridine(8) synthase ThiI [Candidatus Nealsonbacteria bacterium]